MISFLAPLFQAAGDVRGNVFVKGDEEEVDF